MLHQSPTMGCIISCIKNFFHKENNKERGVRNNSCFAKVICHYDWLTNWLWQWRKCDIWKISLAAQALYKAPYVSLLTVDCFWIVQYQNIDLLILLLFYFLYFSASQINCAWEKRLCHQIEVYLNGCVRVRQNGRIWLTLHNLPLRTN